MVFINISILYKLNYKRNIKFNTENERASKITFATKHFGFLAYCVYWQSFVLVHVVL